MVKQTISIILIILLGFTSVRQCISNYEKDRRIAKLESDSTKIITQIQTEVKEIIREVDVHGSEHVIFKEKEGYISKEAFEKAKNGLADSVRLLLNIKDKQLNEIIRIKSKTEAKNLQAQILIDSLKRRTPTYKDKYVYIKYAVKDSTDSTGYFDFTYDADLKIAKYWKKKWLLGAKTNYVDIWSEDLRMRINSVDKLTISQPSNNFGLKLQGVAGYDLGTGYPSYGAGVRIDLGRLSLSPNHLYHPRDKEWRTSITANYDLIKF